MKSPGCWRLGAAKEGEAQPAGHRHHSGTSPGTPGGAGHVSQVRLVRHSTSADTSLASAAAINRSLQGSGSAAADLPQPNSAGRRPAGRLRISCRDAHNASSEHQVGPDPAARHSCRRFLARQRLHVDAVLPKHAGVFGGIADAGQACRPTPGVEAPPTLRRCRHRRPTARPAGEPRIATARPGLQRRRGPSGPPPMPRAAGCRHRGSRRTGGTVDLARDPYAPRGTVPQHRPAEGSRRQRAAPRPTTVATRHAGPPGELPQPVAGRRRARLAPARPPGSAGRRVARPLAVSYRRVRSFSSAFITIQSSSPRTSRVSLRRLGLAAGRDRRQRRLSRSAACSACGGSSSRMMPQHLVERRLAAAACARAASCRSAARTAARPASRCRCACRRRARSSSACSGLMYSSVPTICAELGEQRPLGQPLRRSPWPRRSRSPSAPACRRTARPARWTA